MKIVESISIFLKGMFMGLADIVPGISGGTIAFITNIYERLISGIKNLNMLWLTNVTKFLYTKKKSYKLAALKEWKRIDFAFFIPLVIGIAIAILIGAHSIGYMLETYRSETLLFFIGLIFSSGIIIFTHIQTHSKKQMSLGVLGILIGLAIAFLIPVELPVNTITLGISGFIASAAMLLPGISGSYILVIFGQYEAVITAIRQLDVLIIGIVALGIILGILIMSRIITYLLSNYQSATLYTLTGLVFGSLTIPLRQVQISLLGITWLILGVIIPLALSYFRKNKK